MFQERGYNKVKGYTKVSTMLEYIEPYEWSSNEKHCGIWSIVAVLS